MIARATATASTLVSSPNATVAVAHNESAVATLAGEESAENFVVLMAALRQLGSGMAQAQTETAALQEALGAQAEEAGTLSEAQAEATSLREALDLKATEAGALSREVAALKLRAERAEQIALELQESLKASQQAELEAAAAQRREKKRAMEQLDAKARDLQLRQEALQQALQQVNRLSEQRPAASPSAQRGAAQEAPRMPMLEDFMLHRHNTSIHSSVAQAHTHLAARGPLVYERSAPPLHELAVRNDAEEIYVAFKMWLARESLPENPTATMTRKLVITHAGVPAPFRRRGILSRTLDELVATLEPDVIEIDKILSDSMREYARTRGYTLAPGHQEANGSWSRKVDRKRILAE